MSKNIELNGQTFNGVSEVELPVSGGTALFKDEDEIVTPSGTKQITANGNHDVSAFANANVNVSGGSIPNIGYYTGTTSNTENTTSITISGINETSPRAVFIDFPDVSVADCTEDHPIICNVQLQSKTSSVGPMRNWPQGVANISHINLDGTYDYYQNGATVVLNSDGTISLGNTRGPLFKANTRYRIWVLGRDTV